MSSTPRKSAAAKKSSKGTTTSTAVPKKRTVTRVTTKTKAATTPKKAATTKQRKTRNVASPTRAKRSVKSTKTETKKKPAKRTSTSSKQTVATKQSTSTPPTSDSEPTLTLPNRMSIRAREKVLVLAEVFDKDFYGTALALARAGGACFLVVGAAVIFLNFGQEPFANAVCDTAAHCQKTQLGLVQNALTTVQDPTSPTEVKLLAAVPSVVTSPITIPFTVPSTQSVLARVVYITGSGIEREPIPVESIGNNKYELYLDPTTLEPNQYELLVTLRDASLDQTRNYTLGYFAVLAPREQEELETPGEETDRLETDALQDVVSTDSIKQELQERSADATEPEPILPPEQVVTTKPVTEVSLDTNENDDTISARELTETTSDAEQSPEAEEPVELLNTDEEPSQIEAPDVPVKPLSDKLDLDATPLEINASRLLSGPATVTVSRAQKGATILFYIRPVQTLNVQSLGQLIPSTRNFRFDTRQFPNGLYQLYAESRSNDTVTKSNTIQFAITNSLPARATVPEATPETSTSTIARRDMLDIASELTTPQTLDEVPSEIVTNLPVSRDQTATATVSIKERTRSVLQADAAKLNEIYQRYAVAEQSGDDILISEAKKAIETYRQQVVSTALTSELDQPIAQELNEDIERELNQLTKRVQTFESIRRDRTESASAVDTDGDGISDFDEITLYNTDPTLADTDNDGFTDGVEIIRGFNPNNAAIEAAITYQSPKESVGIIKTDKLQVSQVEPKIALTTDDTSAVQTIVRGVGLPNSFVTLFIFSTPTIVTVRTEADGTFEYTFSKELEDGQHEVYVALTDNTGSIVAQSEPFTFIKQAQAFTPVDAESSAVTLGATADTEQSSPYRLVLGMSVFALGILLILLGVGLKSNRPEVAILEDRPV